MHLCCISYHDCNLCQTLLRELQKCNGKYNILIMHIIFNIGIGFMIVKTQTWLNNTKRYRAHICIRIYMYVAMSEYIWFCLSIYLSSDLSIYLSIVQVLGLYVPMYIYICTNMLSSGDT